MRRLREAGVTITGISHRPSTIALDCVLGERKTRYFTAISPSDARAQDNAFHDILRQLQAKKVEKC